MPTNAHFLNKDHWNCRAAAVSRFSHSSHPAADSEGASANSPAVHCRVNGGRCQVPKGRPRAPFPIQPSPRDSFIGGGVPSVETLAYSHKSLRDFNMSEFTLHF